MPICNYKNFMGSLNKIFVFVNNKKKKKRKLYVEFKKWKTSLKLITAVTLTTILNLEVICLL